MIKGLKKNSKKVPHIDRAPASAAYICRDQSSLKPDHRNEVTLTGSERRIRMCRTAPTARVIAVLAASVLAGTSLPAQAQKGPPVIRDAEIEQLLKEYTQPILRVAGLSQQNIQVVIINDRAFNAFVADGRRIFINAGALLDADTPNQIIGVLAHEAGHIAGGHLARLRQQLAVASTQSILAMLLGVGALVASARSGNSGLSQGGMAALAGPGAAIQNSLFAYMRAQEEQADRAGVKFLTASGQSAKGMYLTFKRLANQTLYQTRNINPYLQSHPLPSERVAALEGMAKASPYWDVKDSPELQARHDLMGAKLFGFLGAPAAVARRFPPNDHSLAAQYARAISVVRFGQAHAAQAQVDALIQAQPRYPYFHELKGQMLLESGHPAEAIAPLREAIALAPNPALIQIMLGQALVASHDHEHLDGAVKVLQAALTREPESADAFTQLAMAYGQKNDLAHADLASAQAAFMRGDLKTAREIAARAKTRFPVGSPGWVKADDIATYKPPPKQPW
jgi:predicted Zn-dependent protease